MTDNINFNLIDNDFRAIDYSSIGTYNVYMFDGPHSEQDQYDGVAISQPALDDRFTLIVDDYNDPNVQRGTQNAIQALGLTVETSLEIIETYSDYWMEIVGTRGFKGKKTVNSNTMKNILFEEI
jgi:hypothetical protein